MKNLLRIISTTVTFCFLFSTISYEMPVTVLAKTNINLQLSAPLRFGGLQKHQLKEMGRIQMMLFTTLIELADGQNEINPKVLIEKANKYRDGKFDKTHVFLAEYTVLFNGRIKVMARILRNDTDETVATYYAIFSTEKDETNGFNIDVITEKEWKGNENVIKRSTSLPNRASQYPEDAKAIARYVEHELKIDRPIEDAWKKGLVTKIENYGTIVLELLQRLNVTITTPEGLIPIEDRDFYMVTVPTGARKTITISYEEDGEIKESEIKVNAHSSNNAVYFFAEEYSNAGDVAALAHEIGAVCGLPMLNAKGKNALDLRYAKKNVETFHGDVSVSESVPEFETLELTVVDSNNIRNRDYAMAEREMGKIELKETQNKNPYWTAVEKDIKEFRQANTMLEITAEGKLIAVEPEVEIREADYEKVLDLKILRLVQKSRKEMRELVEFLGKNDKLSCQRKFYNNLPVEVNKWIDAKYLAMVKGKFKINSEHVTPDEKITRILLGQIAKWLEVALQASIYINLDHVYASPTTGEFTHTQRGITRPGKTGFYFGELFLAELVVSEDRGDYSKDLITLMLDEAMHVDKEDVAHGRIEKLDDVGEKVDHILSSSAGSFPMKQVMNAWKKSIKNRPWKAKLEGGNIGESSQMIDFFECLKVQFARADGATTAVIYGPSGTGKSKAAEEAVPEMIGGIKNVGIIRCGELSVKSQEEKNESIGDMKYKKLIVIYDIEEADDTLLLLLKGVFRKNSKILILAKDTTFLKNEKNEKLKWLQNKITLYFEMPSLASRGDDIIRLAEYFNKESSKSHNISYSPIDFFTGERIKSSVEKSEANICDLRSLIYNIVANRTILLNKKELPEDSLYCIGWRNFCGDYFSSAIITWADVLYTGEGVFLDRGWMNQGETHNAYSKQKTIMPYFEQLAPCDANGKRVGFYKGLKGEQPGLVESRSGSLPEEKKGEGERLRDMAREVGIKIAPPMSNYTLFVAYDIATSEDFEKDRNVKYASRFGLEKISTNHTEELVDRVLNMIQTQRLKPENVIVQLPKEFSEERYQKKLTVLKTAAPGIRFMIIDTVGLKDDNRTSSEQKAEYREIIYSMMLLARYADKDKPDTKVDSLLKDFIGFCFKDSSDETNKWREDYIKALKFDNSVEIVKVALSYKWMVKYVLSERAMVSAELMSA
ncbi:MAG: hypothetical protein ABH844_06555 [Candidatus Omnitrophota bacterium]